MSSSDSEGVTSTLSKADKKARKEEKRARKAEKEAKRQRKEEKRRKRARDDGDGEGDESRKDDGDDDKAAKKKRKAEKKARKEAKKEKASASSDVDKQPKAGSSSTQPGPAATKPSTGATTFSSRARQHTPSYNPFAPTTSPAPRGMTPFFPNRPPPPPGVAAAGPSSSTNLDPRDFPPGLDLSAINANLALGTPSSSSSSSAPRRITTAAFEAAITSSSSNKTPRIRAQASKKGESASSGGESLQKSREGTIEDARGLSQAQILAHKLYQPHQLKWLEEAGMLTTLRKGVFTDTEREAMHEAFSSFWKKHKMSFEQGQEVLGSRDHKGQADLYAQMTSAVTESVPGRSQRAVRRYVRETFHPNARKGQWTDKDIMTLTRAYKEVGPNWTAIAQRVGRIARDCRTRWRDHGGEDQRLVGDGTVPGITEETSTGKLSGGSAAGTSSNAGASTSASATASASTSTSTSTTASWTSAEIKELLTAVPEVCAQLNVDLASGGLPSWSVVSARIKTKPASSCQRKWDEIRIARLKGKSDEDIIANKRTGREDSYLGARDNKRLVERLEEGGWEDEKEIDWGKVMDEDALVFGKNELSKAWKRLKDRVQGGEKKGKGKGKKGKEGDSGAGSSKAKKPTFKELLAQLKPIVDEEHAKWLQAEEEKERDGATKKRKKRGADDSSRSPSGSPSKRPKRAMGTGAVDLGDEIGSDEDW